MTDKKDSQPGPLDEEDADLWQSMTQDVRCLPGKSYAKAGVDKKKAKKQDSQQAGGETIVPKRTESVRLRKGQELDRRTEDRLRKGQMKIESTLDLHGYTQDKARAALERFITEAFQQQKRCVLVITGKGKAKTSAQSEDWVAPKPGVLKRRVPEWLSSMPIGQYVLKTHVAKHKDGGDGALYVLLRRQR